MKKRLFLTLLSLSLSGFCADEDYCKSEIKFIGGQSNIPESCFDIDSKKLSVFNHRVVGDFEIKVMDEILFIKNTKTKEITRLAGDHTGLTNILSVDIDDVQKLIYALNLDNEGEKAVFAYKLNWQGNPYPFRSITAKHLPQDIKQVVVDHKNQKLLGLSDSGKKIYFITPGESNHSDKKFHPMITGTKTFKDEIKHLHAESKAITLVEGKGNWKTYANLDDKDALDSGNDISKHKTIRQPSSLKPKEERLDEKEPNRSHRPKSEHDN